MKTKTTKRTTTRSWRGGKKPSRRPHGILGRHGHYMFMVALLLVNLSLWLIPAHYAGAAAQGYLWYYEEQQFLSIINSHRSSIGAGSLAASDCLTRASRAWAQQMANDNTLYHSPNGYNDSFCGGSISVAENALYTSVFSDMTAQGAFNVWYNSGAHRSNMEDGDYTHTGLGFYWDETHGKLWAVEQFYNCDFGCLGGVTASPSYPSSDNASCRELEAPDSVQTGQGFSALASWTNAGTSTWFTSFTAGANNSHWGKTQISFDGDSFGPGGHSNPGMIAGYSESFTAPGAAGSYEFSWGIRNGNGSAFGAACSKAITVTAPASSGGGSSGSSNSSTGSGGGTTAPATNNPPTPKPKQTTPTETPEAKEAKQPKTSTATQSVPPPKSFADRLRLTSTPTKVGFTLGSIALISLLVIFHARLHLTQIFTRLWPRHHPDKL